MVYQWRREAIPGNAPLFCAYWRYYGVWLFCVVVIGYGEMTIGSIYSPNLVGLPVRLPFWFNENVLAVGPLIRRPIYC